MLKGKPGAIVMAVLGGAALYYTVGALAKGVINFGGGRGRDYFVTWAENPKLFLFGVIMFVALGAGCCALALKFWKGDDD